MNIRRLLPITALVVILVLVVATLPAHAQDGQPCQTCPVSFETPTIFNPGSVGAAEIRQLFYVILGLATFVFVAVEGLLFYSIFRFRNRPVEQAVQTHGNTKLEIAWTILPAIVLVVLLGFTLRTMASVRAPVQGQAVKVKVIGHQWWWEFQYPDLGVKTANQLYVPVGRPIQVELQSVDVQHGFWAPQLFGKMDAVPGHLNKMNFTVTEAGEYGAQCTQMCGEQHAMMRFSIVAVSPSEFSSWALAQIAVPPGPKDEAAVRGQAVVMEKCSACHTIGGTQAVGAVGPNLTHLFSRDFIAGGILSLNEDNLKRWIQNPQAIKPGAIMPDLNLDDATASDVVAYLSTLK